MQLQPEPRDGLEWDISGLDPEPRWARQPCLDAVSQVCRRVLGLGLEDRCNIAFHAEGAFNKLYLVESPRGSSLLRVSLPVEPKNKTRGEWTTLQWIRTMTHVPVPKVIAFNDSQDDEIGFEWILMELMPGVSANLRWRKMTMIEKTRLVEQIAEFQSQLFRSSFQESKFRSIGTLSDDGIPKPTGWNPKPGRMVYRIFFWGDNFNYDVPRGPFRSSHDWLSACLDLVNQKQTDILDKEEDEDILEEAQDCLRVATRLKALLPKIFPPLQNPTEPTVIWHDGLSLSNILIDEDTAKITALVDWECVSCQPLWVAAQMPKFLDGPRREEEPQRDNYGDASDADPKFDELDNEGKTILYWIHLMEYEQTQLRKVYAAKMRALWPQWETGAEYGSLKADFLGALLRARGAVSQHSIPVAFDDLHQKERKQLGPTGVFPPFRPPDSDTDHDDDDIPDPFRLDSSSASNNATLSPGIIAAIVVSVLVFFALLIALFTVLHHRRRKAQQKQGIAMKEESLVSTPTNTTRTSREAGIGAGIRGGELEAVSVSGALDPPPPYPFEEAEVVHELAGHYTSGRSESGSGREQEEEEEEEEGEEELGSHATITDGMEPGRHSGSGSV
ncbi:hypothetical protein VTI74DRAFT_8187 [Chaetomium olivicolor]